MTRVKFCKADTFEYLEKLINTFIEGFEIDGYGVKAVTYTTDPHPTAMIVYGNGPTRMSSGARG